MNKNTLVKFSLTLVSAAVLSACGSGGSKGGDDAAQQQQLVAQQKAAVEKAAAEAKAAAEKAAAEKAAAEKAAAEKAAAEKAAEADKKAAEDKAAEDAKKTKGVTVETEATKSGESYGYKHVQKQKSNFNVGHGSEESNNTSLVSTAMTAELDRSLDTVVVATQNFKNGSRSAYVEDFDFRNDAANLPELRKHGATVLQHIHVAGDSADENEVVKFDSADGKLSIRNINGEEVNRVGEVRNDGKSRTKTQHQGKGKGLVNLYQDGRTVYISAESKGVSNVEYALDTAYVAGVDASGAAVVLPNNRVRSNKDTVAEVYGNRTFLEGDSAVRQASGAALAQNDNGDNAPLLAQREANGQRDDFAKGLYLDGGKLSFVQYGRVTTKLNNIDWNDLRDGSIDGKTELRVASYGVYGNDGTENHYFYRSNTSGHEAVAIDALKKDYAKDGKVVYNGHAVTYGLNHGYNANKSVGNAVGGEKNLVSGTHVQATIDLDTKAVSGSLYDNWLAGNNGVLKPVKNTLVKFDGKLNVENGSIVGDSVNVVDESKGTFNANVFFGNVDANTKSNELGGQVKSLAYDDKAWGAVFGAKATGTPSVASGLTDGTDEHNSTAAGQ